MQRLAIVVPFRDRDAHLSAFTECVSAYFSRAPAAKNIPYRVLIVEQAGDAPFNRGALCNAGFLLAENGSDYACFHDIDYLPIEADYSLPSEPTAIVWYGAEV